jgi:hypothetical protein
MTDQTRFQLNESDLPKFWFNAKGEKRIILFNLLGHSNFDMAAYKSYLRRKLEEYEYPAEAVKESMSKLPQVTLPA